MAFYCNGKKDICDCDALCADCKYFDNTGGKKVPTNADRIRAMSDEELADNWMRDFVVCHRCAYRYECECDEYVTYEKCKEGIEEWLRQPAEELSDD